MGNEVGSLSHGPATLTGAPSTSNMMMFAVPKRPSGMLSLGVSTSGGQGAASEGTAATNPVDKKGGVSVGDRFVTWHSSRKEDVSYVEGKVIEVKRKRGKKYVVLEFRAELEVDGLRASVERAQQALTVEKLWTEKLASLGLTTGADVELWVPEVQFPPSPSEAGRARVDSSLASHLESPRRSKSRRSSPNASHGNNTAATLGGDSIPTRPSNNRVSSRLALTSIGEDDNGAEEDDDNEADNIRKALSPNRVDLRRLSGDGSDSGDEDGAFEDPQDLTVTNRFEIPGELAKHRVTSVDMSWHFHDAVVEIELARIKPNGKLADPKLMTYKQVRTMLDDAAQAKALLDARLREVQQHEAISVGAKVDLWIDELDTNVRAVITDIGHAFSNLSTVELKPSAKYFVDGKKYHKTFDDYVAFTMSWKQAKYVTEQQVMLTNEAFSKGVTPSAVICIFQSPQSARWALKTGGSLDAEVLELKFLFDAESYTVSMQVLVQYASQSSAESPQRRTATFANDDPDSREWIAWAELQQRLRAKLVVSQIRCTDISTPDGRKADPYVKLVLGASKRKTPPMESEMHPTWEGLECTFREGEDLNRNHKSHKNGRRASVTEKQPLTGFFGQVLKIRVFDGRKKTFLGLASFSLEDLVPMGHVEFKAKLGPDKGDKPSKVPSEYGTVLLTLTATGPGITRKAALRHGANEEFAKQQGASDGKDFFFEQFGSE